MTKERKFEPVKGESANKITFIRASSLFDEGITGEIVQGTFVGAVPNSIDTKKDDFKIEKEDGSIVLVNGAGNLGYQMKQVDIGEYIQILYQGKQEISKGPQKGRLSHNFQVNRES